MEPAGVHRHHQFDTRQGRGKRSYQRPGRRDRAERSSLGFVAFLFAKLLDVKLGNRKTVAIILLIAEIVIAIIGLLIMIRMFSVLYAA